jgi:hypothetical protein
VCECMKDAVLCQACGTWTRNGEMRNGQKYRYHFLGHRSNGLLTTGVFEPHTPERCRLARDKTMGKLYSLGLLRDSSFPS